MSSIKIFSQKVFKIQKFYIQCTLVIVDCSVSWKMSTITRDPLLREKLGEEERTYLLSKRQLQFLMCPQDSENVTCVFFLQNPGFFESSIMLSFSSFVKRFLCVKGGMIYIAKSHKFSNFICCFQQLCMLFSI